MKKAICLFICAALLTVLFPASQAEAPVDASVFRELPSDWSSGVPAALENGTVTISEAGTYLLTGNMTGQVLIDAGKSGTVHLVLDGVQITSPDSAAIYIRKAERVILTLAPGSSNSLTSGGGFDSTDDEAVDAVLFSKADLDLNGTGSLHISTEAGNGIVSKDSLCIYEGSYQISTGKNGITAKDLLAVADANIQIECSGDGIRAKSSKEDQGDLLICSGSFQIDSNGDAISATGRMQLDGGTYAITTAGGSKNGNMKASDAAAIGRGFPFGNSPAQTKDTDSAKGIKADRDLTITSGTFRLDCADDAVHTNAALTISGGSWEIRTSDDALHADGALHILDGSFSIPYCYEGMEGMSVTIDSGSIAITATDDGINASGRAESTSFGLGNPDAEIIINGGMITIVSDGDCIDSNGTITITGGTLNLTCGGYGNTAIDPETTFTHTGGEITTNDGSENSTGRGGFGSRGGMGGRGGFGGQDFGDRGQRPQGQEPSAWGQPGGVPQEQSPWGQPTGGVRR